MATNKKTAKKKTAKKISKGTAAALKAWETRRENAWWDEKDKKDKKDKKAAKKK